MITIKAFAKVRELSGETECEIDWQEGDTVGSVKNRLATRSPGWENALRDAVLCACNQQLASEDFPVSNGDEVAYFPPVTGG